MAGEEGERRWTSMQSNQRDRERANMGGREEMEIVGETFERERGEGGMWFEVLKIRCA